MPALSVFLKLIFSSDSSISAQKDIPLEAEQIILVALFKKNCCQRRNKGNEMLLMALTSCLQDQLARRHEIETKHRNLIAGLEKVLHVILRICKQMCRTAERNPNNMYQFNSRANIICIVLHMISTLMKPSNGTMFPSNASSDILFARISSICF